MTGYTISRPPLLPTFELPLRTSLLSLKPGDLVKLIAADENGENAERMWVEIEDKTDEGREWRGVWRNTAFALPIEWGDPVAFHPADVIDFERAGVLT